MALSGTCKHFHLSLRPYLDRHVVVKGKVSLNLFCHTSEEIPDEYELFDDHGQPQERNKDMQDEELTTELYEPSRMDQVQSLTIKILIPPKVGQKKKKKTKKTKEGKRCPFSDRYFVSLLNYAVALMPGLTSLRIYDCDLKLFDNLVNSLGAWAPELKVFHLYQKSVEASFLTRLLSRCSNLEEVKVSGLRFRNDEQQVIMELEELEEDHDMFTPEEEVERAEMLQAIYKHDLMNFEGLAKGVAQHPHLRHFASDRTNKDAQDESLHGRFLRHLCTETDKLPGSNKLQSLELRDNDCDAYSLMEFLSRPASAGLKQLSVRSFGAGEMRSPSRRECWQSFCTREYENPCFFQSKTDLVLACHTETFPMAFFERVGHRITALYIYSGYAILDLEHDWLLSSLRSGLLPRLEKVTMQEGTRAQYTKMFEHVIGKTNEGGVS